MEDKNYYDQGGLSVIEIWKKKLTPEQLEGAFKSNVLKYVLRAGLKDDKVKDLKKALQYLMWWIEEEEKKNEESK